MKYQPVIRRERTQENTHERKVCAFAFSAMHTVTNTSERKKHGGVYQGGGCTSIRKCKKIKEHRRAWCGNIVWDLIYCACR